MDNRESEDTPRPTMSEMKVDNAGPEFSLNRLSSGVHNLTGTRPRFQPVRIKPLLDLCESDDDDTEPRDSDDNSDAENLQGLPDDDEEDANREKLVSPKIKGGIAQVSVKEEVEDVDRSQEASRSDDILPRNSNSFDFKPEIVLPPSVRKTTSLVPYNFDAVDKPILFTPRASHVASRTETRESSEGQSSFKNPGINTPMKFPQSVLNVPETPLKRSHSDYPQNVVETPGVIFSHWSRNNYLQTPTTYNPILTSTKKEEAGVHFQDPRLRSQRFLNSENKLPHRKPLGESTHFNHPERPPLEHHNIVRRTLQLPYGAESGLLAKENLASESKCEANTARRSLIERDNLAPQGNLTAEAVLLSRTEPRAETEKKSEGVVLITNNFDIEARNGRPTVAGSERLAKPSMKENVNSKSSNPANVQFSVAAKPRDKKYGQLITVKENDYVVLGKLGQGMSGNVFRVQEVKTGELRAIKCVDLSQIDKETAQGCLEEVALLERLRAPCIIHMITYEIKSHWLYVVLEMGDTDLSKLLKSMPRDKQLPLTMILYYWTEMLTAVQHIHDNDVIHSDLKPANFLLVRGRLKLIDFGIASTLNSEMTSVVKNTSLGTLHYISPEAIEDVGGNGDSPGGNNKYKLNFQSDVWSLGCILYGLVYGQTPFEHIRADWAKVAAITNPKQKISFPPAQAIGRRGHSSPPPFLVDVMRRCLQHDKKARPTVRQLLEIPYVGCNCPPASSLPSVSPAILSKIKESLEESEWRQLLDTLERRRPL